jgi:fatty acid-binding protein DegV
MTRVAVVTDSVSCLPPDLAEEYKIHVIPIGLVAGRKVYIATELTSEGCWKLFFSVK